MAFWGGQRLLLLALLLQELTLLRFVGLVWVNPRWGKLLLQRRGEVAYYKSGPPRDAASQGSWTKRSVLPPSVQRAQPQGMLGTSGLRKAQANKG